VNSGFLEGIVRGYKSGTLTQAHYASLTQCETLEGQQGKYTLLPLLTITVDFKTQLSATDYGNFLANEPSPLSTATIADKATQILVDQFNFLRSNSVEPLSKFLDYITCVVINCLLPRS
jgi:V-type H+-transporting ATPase subunit d